MWFRTWTVVTVGGPGKAPLDCCGEQFPFCWCGLFLLSSSEEASAERALPDLHYPVLHTYPDQCWIQWVLILTLHVPFLFSCCLARWKMLSTVITAWEAGNRHLKVFNERNTNLGFLCLKYTCRVWLHLHLGYVFKRCYVDVTDRGSAVVIWG